MERNLLKYIWMHSRGDQLWMLVVILASMPTYFLSLELPKRIVNGPIQGKGFENPGDTETFMQIDLPFSGWLFGEPLTLFSGFSMERVDLLFTLSGMFLLLVFANGMFKLYINTYKGRMGERILRRLRYELFDRVLRYPLSRFRRTKASEIATMIKDEVEPMGEYIGDAFTQPLFLGGQALVALLFIFLQNAWLGLATLVVIAFQAWLIPLLRRRLIELQRERQIAARKFAGRLGEIVEGIQDSHTNDITNYQRAEITSILGRLFFIRFELFQRKFSVKFINNLLIQFLAFFFYAVGGYLAIRGTLDIGQLIGVIVAYKDLPAPVRGLIDQDQKRLAVEARYAQIVEQFAADDLQDPARQSMPKGSVPRISRGYEVTKLAAVDDTGSKLIENATVTIGKDEKVAIVGNFNSGARNFAEILAGVLEPSSGKALLDGQSIHEHPEYITGRRLGYIDGNTYFPQGTIIDVLTYILRNQPVSEAVLDVSMEKRSSLEESEIKRAGNFDVDYNLNWINYEELGLGSEAELVDNVRAVLCDVGMEADVHALGLRGTLNPETHPELAEKLLEARKAFRERLDELGFSEFVEPFDPDRYNGQSSIAENLLFGTALDDTFKLQKLPDNKLLSDVLKEQKLEETLFEMGKEVAETTIELFGDLDPDNPFFDQLNYMNADDLPEYRATLNRIGNKPLAEATKADRRMIMELSFSYTEEQNRLGLLSDELKEKLLQARRSLHERLEKMDANPVAFYEPDKYNPAASLQDNVLLGRVSQTVAEGNERVSMAIRDLLDEMGLTDDIFHIGLTFNIGSGGKRLTTTQRQKMHLARAMLKKPDILIANQAMNNLGTREQGEIISMVLEKAGMDDSYMNGVIWVPMNAGYSAMFDRVLVFEDGVLIADDTPEALKNSNETYQSLIS